MASLDDILTTQKNGVQAINAYVNGLNRLAGTNSTKKIAASTTQLVKSSAGWLATVSIITTGDIVTFYDTNNTCLLYTSPSPRDGLLSRMPSSA